MKKDIISPKMTVLDVISRYEDTEAIFKKYEEKTGACILCEALFEPIQNVAERYDLDLKKLLAELVAVANLKGEKIMKDKKEPRLTETVKGSG